MKHAVILYWSSTGNTEKVAFAIKEGLESAGVNVSLIKTTEAKAKEVSGFAAKFITRAKKKDLAATRYVLRFFTKKLAKKLVEEIAPRYKNRSGGYTKIIKLGERKRDGAKMAIIELVK